MGSRKAQHRLSRVASGGSSIAFCVLDSPEARQAAGVRRAGSAKFARKVRDVGAARFGPGVIAAAGDFEAAFNPYLQAIQTVDLPARRPRGDPGNYQRVNAVGNALHQRRLAAASAGG